MIFKNLLPGTSGKWKEKEKMIQNKKAKAIVEQEIKSSSFIR